MLGNHNRSTALERSVIGYWRWERNAEGALKQILQDTDPRPEKSSILTLFLEDLTLRSHLSSIDATHKFNY